MRSPEVSLKTISTGARVLTFSVKDGDLEDNGVYLLFLTTMTNWVPMFDDFIRRTKETRR
jgi:hypothetical protein